MITVTEAENIIGAQVRDFGTELVPFEKSLGRVLAEDIVADRPMPACNRVTMDGIAISYAALAKNSFTFRKVGIQAAGDKPLDIHAIDQCVEIMTGAALPDTTDTVIRYEDLTVDGDEIVVNEGVYKRGQNIHPLGIDKRQGDTVIHSGTLISPAEITMLASVGKQKISVRRLPKVAVISTGDELLPLDSTPQPWELRSSNGHTIEAVLLQWNITADLLHLPDDAARMGTTLRECLQVYDILILSGGVSMGKFDYLPAVLEKLNVKKLFHKVQQRPGKPFWFGSHEMGKLVFAFPGNPVSTFMCLHRYLLPWLHYCLYGKKLQICYARLSEDFNFNLPLQYFLQVKLSMDSYGQLWGIPLAGNGSGDFANLTEANAFMELPLEACNFKKGTAFPVWLFKRIF